MTDPALLELRLLREAVAALAAESRFLQARLLGREDRAVGRALLPLAAELVGERPFTGQGLLAVALSTRTSVGQAVRELIVEAADGAGGMRAFGRLLQRLQGVPLAGYRLVPAGECREGLRWRLQVSGD